MMSERMRLAFLLFLAAILLLTSGCASWNVSKSLPWSKDDQPQLPTKVVAIWTDTVHYAPDQPAMRGYGGRLMFYATEGGPAVKVEGALVVYGFDETNRKRHNTKPDRKYVFTPEQFAEHYSKSKLGHSYSVWLPWDEAGGTQRKISLIVRFVPKSGSVLISEQTTQLLPGAKLEEGEAPAPPASGPGAEGGVRPVSHETPLRPLAAPGPIPGLSATAEPNELGSHIRTTTIYVPPNSNLTTQQGSPVNIQAMRAALAAAGQNPAGQNGGPQTTVVYPQTPGSPAAAPEFRPWQPPRGSQPARSLFARPRALGEPVAQPRPDHAPKPLHRGASPSDQPLQSQAAPGS